MWREGLVEEKVGMAGWWDVAAARGCEEGKGGGAGHRGGRLRGGADEWGIGREVTCLFERGDVLIGQCDEMVALEGERAIRRN